MQLLQFVDIAYYKLSPTLYFSIEGEVAPEATKELDFELAISVSVLFSIPIKSGWVIAHPVHPVPAHLPCVYNK